jgi:hypothetical protein
VGGGGGQKTATCFHCQASPYFPSLVSEALKTRESWAELLKPTFLLQTSRLLVL